VPVGSGSRQSQFAEFAANWSGEDKGIFWEFINVRADHLFDESFSLTVKVQDYLRIQSVGITKLLVSWWDAGVHPVQEGELLVWNDYDAISLASLCPSASNALTCSGLALVLDVDSAHVVLDMAFALVDHVVGDTELTHQG
jgi:hypothetical protein